MNIKIKTSRSFYWIMSSLLVIFASDTLEAQNCVAPPSGMVAWWPGDGNANEIIGSNRRCIAGRSSSLGPVWLAKLLALTESTVWQRLHFLLH